MTPVEIRHFHLFAGLGGVTLHMGALSDDVLEKFRLAGEIARKKGTPLRRRVLGPVSGLFRGLSLDQFRSPSVGLLPWMGGSP